MRLITLAIALTAGLATGALAHGDLAGEPGDATLRARVIAVTAADAGGHMSFTPESVDVALGEQVRFEIRNAGALEHEFVIGTKDDNAEHAKMMLAMPDMKHDDGNAVTVAAGHSASLVWRFTSPGVFEFACLIPGHYEAGMHGIVTVK
jgi:uncharacterized cupredoxin-like copper-binding protein